MGNGWDWLWNLHYTCSLIYCLIFPLRIDHLSSDRAPGMAKPGPSQRAATVWGHVGRTLLLPVHAKDDQRPELSDEVGR